MLASTELRQQLGAAKVEAVSAKRDLRKEQNAHAETQAELRAAERTVQQAEVGKRA